MVNMASNSGNLFPDSIIPYRGKYTYYVNNGHLQKGNGIGGILKGWARRAIPIIKSKAKSLGKDLAIQGLDSIYEAGRDMLVNIKDPPEVNNFKSTFTSTSNKDTTRPKKAIKRKNSSKPISRRRNFKRKRPNQNFATGFRKVTL